MSIPASFGVDRLKIGLLVLVGIALVLRTPDSSLDSTLEAWFAELMPRSAQQNSVAG